MVVFQEFRHLLRIGHMPVHAQAEGFDALDRLPTVERGLASADVAQRLHPRLEDEGRRTQVGVDQPMIAGVWLCEIGETAVAPIKVAPIHNHAANGGAVPADELGGGVDDDVGAPFKRPEQIGRGKGIVDQQRDVMFLGNGRYFLKGKDGDVRVAQRFAVDQLGILLDGRRKRRRICGVYKGDGNAQPGQSIVELVVGAPIQTTAADDMVARLAKGQNGHDLRPMATAGGHCSHAPFQVGDALFQDIGGGVHDARIDIAELFEGKEVGSVFGVIELETGGLVKGYSPAAGGGVGLLAGV